MTFFHQLARRLAAYMSGRNGIDQLAVASLAASLALQMAGSLLRSSLLLLLSLALFGWSLYRIFSRRREKREEENRKFMQWFGSAQTKARQFILRMKLRKEYKYFKCPQCGALLRLKRGGGEKQICCPKCQHQFQQRS